MKLVCALPRVIIVAVLLIISVSHPVFARNKRIALTSTNGKAPLTWANAGIKKFIKDYAGNYKYRIISGSERSWKKYRRKSHINVTRVTYRINGNKRIVAYVHAYSKQKTFLLVVFNAGSRQQSLERDIIKLLKNVK